MKRYIIVVAGGKGTRMGGDIPKQFQLLAGKPLLMVTLEHLHALDSALQIILVLPQEHIELWKSLCKEYAFEVPMMLATGGTTRFHSVQNGLALVDDIDDALVGVHDGVRPFVSQRVYDDAYREALISGAAIPMIEIHDSLRHIIGSNGASEVVPRDRYRLVQTPQVFKLSVLREAYTQRYVESFTDDASVLESIGIGVKIVEGEQKNIKITTPEDVFLAESYLRGELDNEH